MMLLRNRRPNQESRRPLPGAAASKCNRNIAKDKNHPHPLLMPVPGAGCLAAWAKRRKLRHRAHAIEALHPAG